MAERFVLVTIDDDTFACADCEESEHVTARQRGDECRFGVDALRIAEKARRCGSLHHGAILESPVVVAAVRLVGKIGVYALPAYFGFVFGHLRNPLAAEKRRSAFIGAIL